MKCARHFRAFKPESRINRDRFNQVLLYTEVAVRVPTLKFRSDMLRQRMMRLVRGARLASKVAHARAAATAQTLMHVWEAHFTTGSSVIVLP